MAWIIINNVLFLFLLCIRCFVWNCFAGFVFVRLWRIDDVTLNWGWYKCKFSNAIFSGWDSYQLYLGINSIKQFRKNSSSLINFESNSWNQVFFDKMRLLNQKLPATRKMVIDLRQNVRAWRTTRQLGFFFARSMTKAQVAFDLKKYCLLSWNLSSYSVLSP